MVFKYCQTTFTNSLYDKVYEYICIVKDIVTLHALRLKFQFNLYIIQNSQIYQSIFIVP